MRVETVQTSQKQTLLRASILAILLVGTLFILKKSWTPETISSGTTNLHTRNEIVASKDGCPATPNGEPVPRPQLPIGFKIAFESQEASPRIMTMCGSKMKYKNTPHDIMWLYSGSTSSVAADELTQWYVRKPLNNKPCMYSFESVAHPGWYLSTRGTIVAGDDKTCKWGLAKSFTVVDGYAGSGVSFEYSFEKHRHSLGFSQTAPRVDKKCELPKFTGGFRGRQRTFARSDVGRALHSFKICSVLESEYRGHCNGIALAANVVRTPGRCEFTGKVVIGESQHAYKLTPSSWTTGVLAGESLFDYEMQVNGDIKFTKKDDPSATCVWTKVGGSD